MDRTDISKPAAEATRHTYHEFEGRRWPVLIGFALAALAFSAILVFGSRWVYRSLTNSSKPTAQTVPANKLPKTSPAPAKSGSSAPTEQSQPSPTPVSQPLPTTGG